MDFDSIDEKTAFKLGFAQRCFELGLEPNQVKEAMEKSAIISRALPLLRSSWQAIKPWLKNTAIGIGGFGTGLLSSGGAVNAAKDIGGMGIGLGAGAGLLGGGLLGYAKAKLDEEDVDEDAIKAKELAETYKSYAERLRAQKAYQQYKSTRLN